MACEPPRLCLVRRLMRGRPGAQPEVMAQGAGMTLPQVAAVTGGALVPLVVSALQARPARRPPRACPTPWSLQNDVRKVVPNSNKLTASLLKATAHRASRALVLCAPHGAISVFTLHANYLHGYVTWLTHSACALQGPHHH